MHFDRLHYFQTVADELNMTRAAEKLHLSQQALSSLNIDPLAVSTNATDLSRANAGKPHRDVSVVVIQ